MSRNEAMTQGHAASLPTTRRWLAVASMVAALLASIVVLFHPVTASADDAADTTVSIDAERIGVGEYKLKLTNTGERRMLSVSGTTSVPKDILAEGQPAVAEWTIGAVPAGESAYAQYDGADLVINVTETTGDDPQQEIVDNTTTGRPDAGVTDDGADTLPHTGGAVTAVALLAVMLACFGVSAVWRNGRVAVRRTVAATGAVALVAAMAAAVTPQADAAQRVGHIDGIVSGLAVNGRDYQLVSDVDVTYDDDIVPSETTSVDYAQAMGAGWNLGNSFDGVDTDLSVEDTGEEAWGNPKVTRELIRSIKDKGYTSIRIPMTVYHRFTEHTDAAQGEYRYVIDAAWLARYREVVDWAVDEGLYVMINVHHDSWIWLSDWNGDTTADEYRMYTDFWKQIAAYFADEPSVVSFETINEPQFSGGTDEQRQAKLDAINLAAYEIIRATDGNQHRMIVLPTLGTAHEDTAKLQALVDFIKNDVDDDPCVLATVHYYSEWVYSANLGKTGFDEDLWGSGDYTPRDSIDQFAQRVDEYFTANAIGTVVGEYGLLGYDASSDGALQAGEELKYYECMGSAAREHGFSYVFWDNGSGVDRTTFQWKKPAVGAMLEASITQRSSYATGLDTVFLASASAGDIAIPLTLNGNEFQGIDGLTEGVDYTYDPASATVTLSGAYVEARYTGKGGDGIAADLTFRFSGGADWHEYLVRSETPAAGDAASGTVGTRTDGLTIPMSYHGDELKSVTAYQVAADGSESRVGPNSSWWVYLQNGGSFAVQYDSADRVAGTLTMLPAFFADATVGDGTIRLSLTFQSDAVLDDVTFTVAGDTVTVN